MFFSLLLLVCSVSTNPTEADNEIVDQQISNQQPCPQDIHAVLREMAVSLAVQKAQIMILQKENQGTVSCQVVRDVTGNLPYAFIFLYSLLSYKSANVTTKMSS